MDEQENLATLEQAQKDVYTVETFFVGQRTILELMKEFLIKTSRQS